MSEVNVTWCKDFCDDLVAFNRLAKIRGTNLPIRAVCLIGSQEDVEVVVKNEKELFKGFIFFNEKMTRKDAIYFYSEASLDMPSKHLTMEVSGANRGTLVKRFMKDLHLSNSAAVEKFDQEILTKKLEEDYDGLLMTVLLNNIKHSEDGVFSIEDLISEVPLKKLQNSTVETSAIEGISSAKETPAAEKTSITENASVTEKTPVTEEVSAVEKTEETPAVEKKESSVPKPTKKKEEVKGKSKQELTDEEKRSNEEKLKFLQERYKEVSTLINDSKDNRFKAIAKQIDDAVATNVYKTQWCPLYLNISDDTSSDIYAALYDLDIDTLDFNKTIIRQTIHLGCAFCGHEWDEDITFKPSGVFFAECPECYTERPFEKE